MTQKNRIQLDEISKFFLFGLVLSTLMFANGFYLFACTATFVVLFFYVQQPFRSGMFALLLLQHFLQIIATVFYCNYLGENINFRSSESGRAIVLSLVGLVVLLSPVLYFQHKLPRITAKDFRNFASTLSTDKAMYFYVAAFFITSSLGAVAFLFSGFTQIIFSLVKIKWLFFLLFGFLCIIKKEKIKLFYLFVALEFSLGFFSYFSDFKIVIYYLLILLLSFVSSINFKHVLSALLIGGALLLFALVWSTVKSDYRNFLNRGTGKQTVGVSRDDALNKLYDLSNDVDRENLENSTKGFLDRLQYTYHFAKALERVPAVIPYQNGANWLQVLQYTTTPRFLNPDKPTVDNSVKASKYTGIPYARASQGVSFSLGYFAECYIDFGPIGMMFPLLILGLLYGKLYQYFITKASPNLLINYAVVGSFFMEFYAFEMDATILTGRLFASIVTYFFLIQFVFPTVYKALLIKPVTSTEARSFAR